MKVELKNYIKPETQVLVNRDFGHAVFTQVPYLEMIRLGETVELVIPRRIKSVNPSFLEGFLKPFVDNGMQDKIKFKFLGTNYQHRVENAISSLLRESELLEKGHYYYCDSFQGWFVCFADNQRKAKSACILEYGHAKQVRRATFDEIEEFCKIKGIDKLWSWARIAKKDSKEANRRFQMRA